MEEIKIMNELNAKGYEYYYEELPLSWIISTEKELEKRFKEDEYKLVLKCRTYQPAMIELHCKNGKNFVAARKKLYVNGQYQYRIQLLDDTCKNILLDYSYTEGEMYPLFMLAVKVNRVGRRNY